MGCLTSRLRRVSRLAGCVLALSLAWSAATNISPSIRNRREPIPEDDHVYDGLADLFETRDPSLSLHLPSACEMGPKTVNEAIALDAHRGSLTPHTLQIPQTYPTLVPDHTTSSKSIRVRFQTHNRGSQPTADSQQQPASVVDPNSRVEDGRFPLQGTANSDRVSSESPRTSKYQPKPAKFMASRAARPGQLITPQSSSHSRLITERQAQTFGQEISKSQPDRRKRKWFPEMECDSEHELLMDPDQQFLVDLVKGDQILRTLNAKIYIMGELPYYKFTLPTSLMIFVQSVIESTEIGHEIMGVFRELVGADSRTGPDERSCKKLAMFIDKYSTGNGRGFKTRKEALSYAGRKAILRISSRAAILRVNILGIDDEISRFFNPLMRAAKLGTTHQHWRLRDFLQDAQTTTTLVLYQIELLYRLPKHTETAIDLDQKEQVILAWQNLKRFWQVKFDDNKEAALEENQKTHNCFHVAELYNKIDQHTPSAGNIPRRTKFARLLLFEWLLEKNRHTFHSMGHHATSNFFSFWEDCSVPDLIHMVTS